VYRLIDFFFMDADTTRKIADLNSARLLKEILSTGTLHDLWGRLKIEL
jgi:hypothetical protein